MNRGVKYLLVLLLVTACATPQTVLQKDGKVVTCGGGTAGSIAGGMVGYSIQKNNDKDCVENYKKQGFAIIKHADE